MGGGGGHGRAAGPGEGRSQRFRTAGPAEGSEHRPPEGGSRPWRRPRTAVRPGSARSPGGGRPGLPGRRRRQGRCVPPTGPVVVRHRQSACGGRRCRRDRGRRPHDDRGSRAAGRSRGRCRARAPGFRGVSRGAAGMSAQETPARDDRGCGGRTGVAGAPRRRLRAVSDPVGGEFPDGSAVRRGGRRGGGMGRPFSVVAATAARGVPRGVAGVSRPWPRRACGLPDRASAGAGRTRPTWACGRG